MLFNINNKIRVKLTDRGREILKQDYEKVFNGELLGKYPYTPPKEDKNGWSEWQMWDLMSKIGSSFNCGMKNAIETEIEIIEQ